MEHVGDDIPSSEVGGNKKTLNSRQASTLGLGEVTRARIQTVQTFVVVRGFPVGQYALCLYVFRLSLFYLLSSSTALLQHTLADVHSRQTSINPHTQSYTQEILLQVLFRRSRR